MDIFDLTYFKKADSICGDDFKNKEEMTKINLLFLLSLSELKTYELPFSGTIIDKYAVVTMSNNDIYHIKEDTYTHLMYALSQY